MKKRHRLAKHWPAHTPEKNGLLHLQKEDHQTFVSCPQIVAFLRPMLLGEFPDLPTQTLPQVAATLVTRVTASTTRRIPLSAQEEQTYLAVAPTGLLDQEAFTRVFEVMHQNLFQRATEDCSATPLLFPQERLRLKRVAAAAGMRSALAVNPRTLWEEIV
jgi:hypothetical protein